MKRRDVLGTALLGLAAGSTITRQAMAALKASDAANLLKTYALMRGRPNGMALWWYTGTVWGKQTNEIAQPMFGVQGLTFNRITVRGDGSIEQKLTGRGWYSDLKTGQPLERWTNPITGESRTPPHIKSFQIQMIAADGTMPPRDEAAMDAFSGKIDGLTINGDTVWLTENFVAKYKPDAARNGAVNTTSSLSTFTAKVRDVENTEADFVPAYLNYQSLGSWPAWMNMGDMQGVLSWQTRGQKVQSAEAAPADLRAWIDQKHPNFLKTPGI